MKENVLDIVDISYEGAGVGKLDGKVYFVPKTLIGEKVDVCPVKQNQSFCVAKLERVIEPSEKRIIPRCPYFDKCGGCVFQHCSAQTEKELKIHILRNEMKKVGWDGEIDYVESENRFGYRNKIKFEVRDGKLGFFKSKSHDFFEVENCPIAMQNINNSIPKIKEFLKANSLKNLKSVYVRSVDEKLSICFLFDKKSQKCHKNIKKIEILSDFDVFFAYGDILESNSTQIFCIKGNTFQVKKFSDFEAEYNVSAFCQINDFVAEKLYDFVLEKTKNMRVINAYSGQGVLTFLISQVAKFVYGIEYQISAHESAEKLKKYSNEFKFENICGKVEDKISQILLRDNIDMIVLDPAREGCQKSVINSIIDSKIENVLYISCNFSTLTRDLKDFCKNYDILSVKIFNMFPCTANLETVVVLKRKANY